MGELISAVYSSSNGGYTESNANYWGSDQLPYLIAKKDPYDPKNPWQIVLDKQQINTSQLDLSQPEQWWSSVKESQVDTAELKNIKNYLLRQTGSIRYQNNWILKSWVSQMTLQKQQLGNLLVTEQKELFT